MISIIHYECIDHYITSSIYYVFICLFQCLYDMYLTIHQYDYLF